MTFNEHTETPESNTTGAKSFVDKEPSGGSPVSVPNEKQRTNKPKVTKCI